MYSKCEDMFCSKSTKKKQIEYDSGRMYYYTRQIFSKSLEVSLPTLIAVNKKTKQPKPKSKCHLSLKKK